MTNFNPLNFIANHAGMNLVDAIKEAYEQGKRDAQPERKTGEWSIICSKTYRCPVCRRLSDYAYEYCPNCGSDMREGQK